jgi:hypothetical protein
LLKINPSVSGRAECFAKRLLCFFADGVIILKGIKQVNTKKYKYFLRRKKTAFKRLFVLVFLSYFNMQLTGSPMSAPAQNAINAVTAIS